jgi:hypothetical protein
MHSVTMPRLQPSRFIECINRVASTAPLAPIGWPCAMAPPSTLTTSSAKPISRRHASAMAAKASLISTRSTSATDQPARCNAWRTAGTGPTPKKPGSTAPTP